MFNQITDSSDNEIKTDYVSYSVSSNSTNPNVNTVNIKTDHEKEDEVGCSANKEEHFKHSIEKCWKNLNCSPSQEQYEKISYLH